MLEIKDKSTCETREIACKLKEEELSKNRGSSEETGEWRKWVGWSLSPSIFHYIHNYIRIVRLYTEKNGKIIINPNLSLIRACEEESRMLGRWAEQRLLQAWIKRAQTQNHGKTWRQSWILTIWKRAATDPTFGFVNWFDFNLRFHARKN